VVDSTTIQDEEPLDISGLPSGNWIVRVTVHADDAGDDAGVTQFVLQRAEKTPKIKIG